MMVSSLLFKVIPLIVMFVVAFLTYPISYRLTGGFTTPIFSKSNTKPFLYLAQVEDCLQSYHMGYDVFQGGVSFDVLVLSYRRLCKKRHPNHIKYIVPTYKTTWTTGRNYLYRYIKQNRQYQNYLYYVFMDQDVRLVNNDLFSRFGFKLDKEGMNITKSKISPWRKFEQFLDYYRPAIGDVDHNVHYNILLGNLQNSTTGSKHGHTKLETLPSYKSSFLFDAMFNAFHHDVLDVLLPYDDSLELESWWASQQFLQCKAFFRYHAQVILFLPLLAVNKEHSKYPRKLYQPRKICKNEYKLAPEKIQNSSLTKLLMRKRRIEGMPMYSYVAPARTPKHQYKYFQESFMEH